jgi:ribosomal protein L22
MTPDETEDVQPDELVTGSAPQGGEGESDAPVAESSDAPVVTGSAPQEGAEDDEAAEAEGEAPAAEAKPKRTRARKPKAAAAEASAEGDEAEAVAEAPVEEAEQADEKPKPARRRRAAAKPAAEAAEEKPAKKPAAKPAPARTRPAGRRAVVRAQAKYVRTSARKARMVCGHIRGKSVDEARAILAFTPRDVARDWSKLLESAVANAENNHELVGDDLIVHEVYADEGPTIKRFRPRGKGRATPIRKRTSHLTITLTPRS